MPITRLENSPCVITCVTLRCLEGASFSIRKFVPMSNSETCPPKRSQYTLRGVGGAEEKGAIMRCQEERDIQHKARS